MIPFIAHASFLVLIAVTLLFILAVKIKNNSILDVFWGTGFILVALSTLLLTRNSSLPSLVTALLVSIWGARLTIHLYHRNNHKPEDSRYQAFRQQWKTNFLFKSYVRLFLLQGLLLIIISLAPMAAIVYRFGNLTILDGVAMAVWLFGFYFEVVGDQQLKQFKAHPANKGKIMNIGLWRYTRHPNYFGEAVMWWGIWLISLPTPIGLLSIISPITITLLLMKVSGVPMLESKYANNPEYEKYKSTTPSFFPKFW